MQVICVVYRLVSNEWQVLGPGWSVVAVYRDRCDGSHRLVGWTVDEYQLVLNVSFSADCRYRAKSDDFHKLRDDEGRSWGFGFYKREESLREANRLLHLLQAIRISPMHAHRAQPAAAALHSPPFTAAQPHIVVSPSGSLASPSSSSPSGRPMAVRVSSTPLPSSHPFHEQKTNASSPHPSIPVVRAVHPPALPPPSSPSSSSSPTAFSALPTYETAPHASRGSLAAPPRQYPVVSPLPPLTPERAAGRGHAPPPIYPAINPSNSYQPAPARADAPASKSRAAPPPPLQTLGMALQSLPTASAQSPLSAPPLVDSSAQSYAHLPTARRPSAGDRAVATAVPLSFCSSSSAGTPTAASALRSSPSGAASPVSLSPPSSSTPLTSSPRVPVRPSTQRKNSAPEPKELTSPVLHRTQSLRIEKLLMSPTPVIPLGALTILPPKPSKASVASALPSPSSAPSSSSLSSSSPASTFISDPHAVTHDVHVQYDPATRTYRGLPAELASRLLQQFGLPPQSLERQQLPGYPARIPSVLVQLRTYLVQQGGLRVEGIFRVACDGDEVVQVKRALNEGRFVSCNDIHVVSSLIKVWYRELPVRVLDGVEQGMVELVDGDAAVERVLRSMKELPQSLLCWLLDLCVDVVRERGSNLMGSKSLGIVWSPNLFTESRDDPMKSLLYSQKVATFMQKAIEWRLTHYALPLLP